MSAVLLPIERSLTADMLRRRVRTALERDPADLVLAGARLVNVYSEEIHSADIVVRDGTIVAIREGYGGECSQRIELDGRLALPGLVQAAVPGMTAPVMPGPELGVTTVFAAMPHAAPLEDGALPRLLPTGARAGVIGTRACTTADEVLACTRTGEIALLTPPTRADLVALLGEIVVRKIDTRHLSLSALPAGGVTLLDAIGLAVAAGIPPVRAVQLASLHPATHEMVDHLLGSVAPGKRADLVVLEALGDPLASLVMFEGGIVFRADATVGG